jgi:SP family general alpha glucoside:H+ symporter-like MFS transporter
VYASQNSAGNLIANQATYSFERAPTLPVSPSPLCRNQLTTICATEAGVAPYKAFQLNLITTSLQLAASTGSWFLTSRFRRRTVYL